MVALRICVLAVVIVLGLAAPARADEPALAMDEPKSGIHIDVEGACQVRPADGGGAACRDFAASADKSERFAVVLRPNGLLLYSVAMFTENELGVGEARARRISKSMGESVDGTPVAVTYGGERFLRTQLRTSDGAAICFITADDRLEVAIIMFAADVDSFAAMEPKAEAAMRTLRRTPKIVTPPAPPMTCGSRALLSVFLFVIFGLPVFGFIFRAIRIARRLENRKVHVDEPRGPRKTGPQLAGEKCAACKRTIVVAREGVECPVCKAAVHAEDCLARHRSAKHAAS